MFIEIIKSIVLGIIEGITEWLPVSSTGHIILFDEFIPLDASAAFKDMFFVVIQLGAIAAVCVSFFNKLNPFSRRKSTAERKNTWSLWGKVIIGILPAGIAGLLIEALIDAVDYCDTQVAEVFTTQEEYDKFFIDRYGWKKHTVQEIIEDDEDYRREYEEASKYLADGYAIMRKRVSDSDCSPESFIKTMAKDNDGFVILEGA